MPSPLFNFLFVVALLVPAAMYIVGVTILLLSLFVRHRRRVAKRWHPVEAPAH